MGTIIERKRQDGSSAFTAQIRLRIDGHPHSEARTFNRRKPAEVWLAQRETELSKGLPKPDLPLPIGDLIRRYLGDDPEARKREIGRSKYEGILPLLQDELATVNAKAYTAADLIAYARRRRSSLARRRTTPIQAATVLHELGYLKQLFVMARTEWNEPIDLTPMEDAVTYCRNHRLIGEAMKRERRLTKEEETKLVEYFENGLHLIPMKDVMLFAIHSSRRLGEICRIRWDDLEIEKKVILVRNVKHPKRKMGNDRKSRLTDEALAIIQRQPKSDERIFPYKEASISMAFHQACLILGIENLHFHDLRHEAISRLFEKGYQIHEVALFSLHQSWEHLRRYTHLKAEDIRDI